MSSRKKSRVARPSKFPPEFRRDAIAMVHDESRSIADVARSVGVNLGTLRNGVGQERIERGDSEGLTADERSDLVELRAENTQLRMERAWRCRHRPAVCASTGRRPPGSW